jgi:hypothetical protein
MPQPEELSALLQRRPFRPFRVHLQDGRVFEVRYPDMNIVGTTFVLLGIPEANATDPFAEQMAMVELAQIRQLELAPPSAPVARATDA